jgi:tetratricopeptide (TPR) repeat protein
MKALFSLLVLMVFPVLLTAQQPSGNVGRVEIPGVKGVMEINVGPSPWYLDFLPEDHWTMLHAHQRPDHLIIIAELRQVGFAATPESCKNELWPKMKEALAGKAEDVQESTYGGALRVEYTFNGDQNTKSRHIVSYWGAGDLCVDVHLAKAGFTPQDQSAFEQVLASVRLYPDQSGLQLSAQGQEASSSTLMAQGNEQYVLHNYSDALKCYQRAFELEKANRTFDKDLYLDLIARLAFSYRLNGNLAKSRETLEYGLSQDAEYPIFHYDMACVYAQMGKLDESLGELREAYNYKGNASPGEMPPDPTEDSCFQKFANDPKFTDAVQKLIPQ